MTRNDGLKRQPPARPHGRPRPTGRDRWDPILSADEECELAERIKGGDQTARRRLILANLRLVVIIARRFKSTKLPEDDLVQEGNLGLIRASGDFDPSVHGCRFASYADIWITSYINRYLIANDSLIRVPEHVFQLRKQYRRAVSTLGGQGMDGGDPAGAEPPSVEEIARAIGVSPRRLEPTVLSECEWDTSTPDDEDGEKVPLIEAIIDDNLPDQEVADHEQRVLLEIALRRLNPVEAWLIRERYGLCALIPDEESWSDRGPRAARRDDTDLGPEEGPSGRRTYFHRSYVDLERDCGLSYYRLLQVEQAALEKLGEVLRPCLAEIRR
jgi:RNA polymerase sigma factor (sigma-70 family)